MSKVKAYTLNWTLKYIGSQCSSCRICLRYTKQLIPDNHWACCIPNPLNLLHAQLMAGCRFGLVKPPSCLLKIFSLHFWFNAILEVGSVSCAGVGRAI